jgi:hypothetical protein
LGTAEFEPKDRVRVKSVEGSVIETSGSMETRIRERETDIPFRLQSVSQQVDQKGDGILGRDILKLIQARICYRERSLTFQHEGFVIHKELRSLQEPDCRDFQEAPGGKLTLPARTELIVKLLVSAGSRIEKDLVERSEITSGVYLTERLVTVNSGHFITSILNTTEQDVELPIPAVKLVQLTDRDVGVTAVIGAAEQVKGRHYLDQSRGERVIAKLRADHLNSEENKSLHEFCFDYQDVFFLQRSTFSSTNAAKHTTQLEPGFTPLIEDPTDYPKVKRKR